MSWLSVTASWFMNFSLGVVGTGEREKCAETHRRGKATRLKFLEW